VYFVFCAVLAFLARSTLSRILRSVEGRASQENPKMCQMSSWSFIETQVLAKLL
jgi:uncharacterized membrane protein